MRKIFEILLDAAIVAFIASFGFGVLSFLATNNILKALTFFGIMYLMLYMVFVVFIWTKDASFLFVKNNKENQNES